jgi:hypothetical protein
MSVGEMANSGHMALKVQFEGFDNIQAFQAADLAIKLFSPYRYRVVAVDKTVPLRRLVWLLCVAL